MARKTNPTSTNPSTNPNDDLERLPALPGDDVLPSLPDDFPVDPGELPDSVPALPELLRDAPELMNERQAAAAVARSSNWLAEQRRADKRLIAEGRPMQGPRWLRSRTTGRVFYTRDDLAGWLANELTVMT